MTRGEVKIIGTIRTNFLDSTNRVNVLKGIAQIKDKARGTWMLIRAYDRPGKKNIDALKKKHKENQKELPINEQSVFEPPQKTVSEKAGYVLFMDSKLVIFYSNDLAETPSADFLSDESEDAIYCVNGLAAIKRWVKGIDIFHRSVFIVPSLIAAYNKFMSGVDRMDQRRGTNAIRRKEQRVDRTVFSLVVDLSISNAYALLQQYKEDNKEDCITFRTFKTRVASQLIQLHLDERKKRKKPVGSEAAANNIGSIDSPHVLLPFTGNARRGCFLCCSLTDANLVKITNGMSTSSSNSKNSFKQCVKCQKGFHVNCFAVYHYPHLLKEHRTELKDFVENLTNTNKKQRASAAIPDFSEIDIPCKLIIARI